MKHLRIFLAATLVLLCLLLAACQPESGGETSDKRENESTSSRDENSVTVTFRFGVGSWTSEEKVASPATYKYTREVVVAKGEDVTYISDERLNEDEGYVFEGWDVAASDLKNLEEDITVSAAYMKLALFSYTFKNTNGTVIKTGTAYEFSDITADAPATRGLYYYPTAQKGTLSDPVAYEVDGTTYWIERADESKIQTTAAIPIGSVFVDWKSSEVGTTLSNLKKNNVVFTARHSPADDIIERVAKGTITKETMLDKSLYTKLDKGLQRQVIYNKIDGVTNGDMSIIEKYDAIAKASNGLYQDGLAAANAVSAAEGAAYTADLNNWNRAARGLDATFYMAWDGEFVYFLAEITDANVITQGKRFTLTKAENWVTDCVEVWYAFNNDFRKLSLDACGFKLFSGENTSAYLNYMNEQGYAKTKVTTAIGSTIDTSGLLDPTVIANATGYTVAFAFPAYDEPSDPKADLSNKANWGKKLERGDVFYCSVQINNLSDCADKSVIDAMIAENDLASLSIYNRSTPKKQKSMQLGCVGCQTKNLSQTGRGTLRFALG